MQEVHEGIIVKNQALSPQVFEMTIEAPRLAQDARPGQFVMVLPSLEKSSHDPLLRRPFGLSGIYPQQGQIRFTYQLVGKGTKIMSKWQPGSQVDLIGPLGKGFRLPTDIKEAVIAGGGMGVAPLLPLAQEIVNYNVKVTAFLGARSQDLLLGCRELQDLGCEIHIATEDGSFGYCGFITEPLKDFLTRKSSQMLFACGPTPFLKAVKDIIHDKNIPAQLSLEERMACGLGACMGCAVKLVQQGETKQARVCVDGPVFNAEEVEL